jgi:hypothetical protein
LVLPQLSPAYEAGGLLFALSASKVYLFFLIYQIEKAA